MRKKLDLTSEQQTALNRIRDEVPVDTILQQRGSGHIYVEVTNDWGETVWLGIENDGYIYNDDPDCRC
tara:strand:+ start:45 stop:248 length:204 start_codon:yes stop_codon:yes gene_type:complete